MTDETNEFEDIIDDWNEAIEVRTIMDGKSCFVPVSDLFDSMRTWCTILISFIRMQKDMRKWQIAILKKLIECGLFEMSDGELDM